MRGYSDPEVVAQGTVIAKIDGGRYTPQRIDLDIEEISNISGRKIDWHYDGKDIVVKVVGDTKGVRELVASKLELMEEGDPKQVQLFKTEDEPNPS